MCLFNHIRINVLNFVLLRTVIIVFKILISFFVSWKIYSIICL